MPDSADSTNRAARTIGGLSAIGIAAALLPLAVAAGIAAWTVAARGGVQYRALRRIAGGRCNVDLASARTPLGLKWRFLNVSRGTWSLRSGIPLAASLIPARRAELLKHSTEEDFSSLAQLPSLTHLYIMGPRASVGEMRLLGKLQHLRSLVILFVKLPNAGWRGISRLTRLRKLLLGDDGLNDRIFALMGNLKDLRTLDLSKNSGIVGAHMQRGSPLRRLRRLSLVATRFGDAGMHWVAALPNLEYLDLAFDKALTGRSLRFLAACSKLRELNLSGTRIGDRDLHWIASMHALRILSLGKTRCSTAGITQLRRSNPALHVRY